MIRTNKRNDISITPVHSEQMEDEGYDFWLAIPTDYRFEPEDAQEIAIRGRAAVMLTAQQMDDLCTMWQLIRKL